VTGPVRKREREREGEGEGDFKLSRTSFKSIALFNLSFNLSFLIIQKM